MAADAAARCGGFTIRDCHTWAPRSTCRETLIHSSNIVTAQIADELGADTAAASTMADLGMNERPYIELPARGFPIWPSGEWPRMRAMTVGYGHGIAVTPLHLASAYAAMVNGGIWRPATLIKLEPGDAPRGRRVFKASTSARMNQLLRMIAVYGTGRKADAPGFRVGGKTGIGGKAGQWRLSPPYADLDLRRRLPDGQSALRGGRHAGRAQGTVASSFQRTAAWNAAPIVGRLVPRIGPHAGRAARRQPRYRHIGPRPLVGDEDGE